MEKQAPLRDRGQPGRSNATSVLSSSRPIASRSVGDYAKQRNLLSPATSMPTRARGGIGDDRLQKRSQGR